MELLDIIAKICTILAVVNTFVTIIYKWLKKRVNKRGLGLFLFYSIVALFFGSVALLFAGFKYQWVNVALLLVSVISFLVYAHRAYRSLDNDSTENVLPPIMFWQVLFNKIPARVINTTAERITFALVRMDDSEEVKESAERVIQSCGKGDRVSIKTIDGFKRRKSSGYLYDLKQLLKNKDLSGVIFIIGESADDDVLGKRLRMVIDDFSNVRREVPIGYVQAGNKLNFKLHFEEIGKNQLDNCVHDLIMRGYSRSKMQFDLGNAYHSSFIVLLALLFASVLAIGLFASRETVDNSNLRPKQLSNDIYNYKGSWDSVSVDQIKEDGDLRHLLDESSKYYFSDLNSYRGVKIWLKPNNQGDSLYNVFYNMDEYAFSSVIPDSYCVGQVAKHRLFFLWPGVKNKDNPFFLNNPKVVWTYLGNDDKDYDDKVKNDQLEIANNLWSGKVYENREWCVDTLRWVPSDRTSDDDLAVYCFSYDGALVVEIDCYSGEIEKDYEYMSHLMFRNSVRKYVKFVYCLLQQSRYKSE